MKTLIIIAVSAFVLSAGPQSASANREVNKLIGAGEFMHPTGPAWDVDKKDHR